MLTKNRLRLSAWLLSGEVGVLFIIGTLFMAFMYTESVNFLANLTIPNLLEAILYFLLLVIDMYVIVALRDLLNFEASFYNANRYILIYILLSVIICGFDIFEVFYPSAYLGISIVPNTINILWCFSFIFIGSILLYSKINSIPYLKAFSIFTILLGIVGTPFSIDEIVPFNVSDSLEMAYFLTFFTLLMLQMIVMALMFFKSSRN